MLKKKRKIIFQYVRIDKIILFVRSIYISS